MQVNYVFKNAKTLNFVQSYEKCCYNYKINIFMNEVVVNVDHSLKREKLPMDSRFRIPLVCEQ